MSPTATLTLSGPPSTPAAARGKPAAKRNRKRYVGRGLYIVAGNAHCVGVDANKQLVYDGAEVATLSPAALTHFGVVNDTRRVDIVCLNYDGERA